jgi:hypothetical protein
VLDTGIVQPNPPVFMSPAGPNTPGGWLFGWQSVTQLGPGNYCLTPSSTTNVNDDALVVSLGGPGGDDQDLGIVAWTGTCGDNYTSYAVSTYDLQGNPTNDIEFTAVVP